MKILYICSDFGIPVLGDKGASVHIRQLVQAFINLNHTVWIITPNKNTYSKNKTNAKIIEIKRSKFVPDTIKADIRIDMEKLVFNYLLRKELKRIIPLFQPDFIYERYSLFSYAGVQIAHQYNIPHMLEINSFLREEQQKYRSLTLPWIAKEIETYIYQNSNKIFTVSKILKDKLSKKRKIQQKIQIMPNAVDVNLFSPRKKDTKIVKHYKLNNKFVIGFTGSLKPWHGIDTGIEVIKILKDIHKDMVFFIVGDGPLYKYIKKISDKESLPIILTGSISHHKIPSYLSVMDIALAPYHAMKNFYFSPLKVYEYMAMGKPVIASRLGQLHELIDNGKNGILCKPDNSVSWSHAIDKLYANKKWRLTLGTNARKCVLRKYTWEKNAREIVKLKESKLL